MKKEQLVDSKNKNYIYYRNLFIRFLKENKIFFLIRNNDKYNDIQKIDSILTTIIPEHFFSSIFDFINKLVYKEKRDLLIKWLEYLSKHTLKNQRIFAKELLYQKITDEKLDLYIINDCVKNYRNNCNFIGFDKTIFSDELNKCFDDVCKNAPLCLIPFYAFSTYDIKINQKYGKCKTIDNFTYLIDNWLKQGKKLYYDEKSIN